MAIWVNVGRSVGPDGAHRKVLVGTGGIALICTIQHLGRLKLTSLGLLSASGELIPDVDHIREHGWLMAEQVSTAHRGYVPVIPILLATPFTRVHPDEPPIGFTVTSPWRVGKVLAATQSVLTSTDTQLIAARLRTRLHATHR